jgi:hypothetical protein
MSLYYAERILKRLGSAHVLFIPCASTFVYIGLRQYSKRLVRIACPLKCCIGFCHSLSYPPVPIYVCIGSALVRKGPRMGLLSAVSPGTGKGLERYLVVHCIAWLAALMFASPWVSRCAAHGVFCKFQKQLAQLTEPEVELRQKAKPGLGLF